MLVDEVYLDPVLPLMQWREFLDTQIVEDHLCSQPCISFLCRKKIQNFILCCDIKKYLTFVDNGRRV